MYKESIVQHSTISVGVDKAHLNNYNDVMINYSIPKSLFYIKSYGETCQKIKAKMKHLKQMKMLLQLKEVCTWLSRNRPTINDMACIRLPCVTRKSIPLHLVLSMHIVVCI